MYPNREAFSRPPVVLVTAQVLFTDSPRLRQQQNLDAIAIALESRLPFAEQVTGMGAENPGPGLPPRMAPRTGMVLRNADNTESLTLTSSSLTFETTAYRDFDHFKTGLLTGCRALVAAGVRPALRRIGLRYINEIRVPEPVNNVRDWAPWIYPGVLGLVSVSADTVPVRAIQGAVAFDLGNGGGLNAGYAALNDGTVVNPQFLVRAPFPAGPSFVFDLDGYCEFGLDVNVQLDEAVVADILSPVHGHIGAAFQRSITDKARSLFRGTATYDLAAGRHSL